MREREGEPLRQLELLFITESNLYFPDPNNRVAPSEPPTRHTDGRGYTITTARLAELRSHFLYWYFDKGGSDDIGDYQRSIHASNPQLHKNFNFQLPFFGFRFNYTRVSWAKCIINMYSPVESNIPNIPIFIWNISWWFVRFQCTVSWNFPIHQSNTPIRYRFQ